MNKIFKIKTMLVISSLVIAINTVYAMGFIETHDNVVSFSTDESDIYSINFVPAGQMDLSSGQPYDGTFVSGANTHQVSIDVVAGRHKTSNVAKSFLDGMSDDNVTAGTTERDRKPSELNFWISGNLYINGNKVIDEVKLGQGSSVSNNWWLANKSAHSDKNKYIDTAHNMTYDFDEFDKVITDEKGNTYCIVPMNHTFYVNHKCELASGGGRVL